MGAMDTAAYLAYVFWHWIRAGREVAAYEHALTAFQRALLDNAPPGYRCATVYRHAPATPPLLGCAPRDRTTWIGISATAARRWIP